MECWVSKKNSTQLQPVLDLGILVLKMLVLKILDLGIHSIILSSSHNLLEKKLKIKSKSKC